MHKYKYTSNAWGYYPVGEQLSAEDIARRICALGFDGFDLLIGPEAYPACSIDEDQGKLLDIRHAAESGGGCISSLVLVSFSLADEADCVHQLRRAGEIAKILDTNSVNLLPRKLGIIQDEGFRRLAKVWNEAGRALHDTGLVVSAENHIWAKTADEDIFLLRTEEDFYRLLEVTDGQVLPKFDPAWLLMAGAESPLPAFKRLSHRVRTLDLKDFRDDKFVTPGTGKIDFAELALAAAHSKVTSLSIEVEEHHFQEPPLVDPVAIDALHAAALRFYREIFG